MNFIDSKTDLFKDLSETHRRAVMDAASSIVLEKRQRLFFQGDPAQHVYLIDQGVFKLYETTRSGETSIFWFLGPGELMALVSVFPPAWYPVSATATQECRVFKWESGAFMRCMQDHPQLAVNIVETVLHRQKSFQRRFSAHNHASAEQRIARAIVRFIKWVGRDVENGVLIDFPLTRQDLADFTSVNMHTASRVLSSWKKRGWIVSKREKIIVKNPEAIQGIATEEERLN